MRSMETFVVHYFTAISCTELYILHSNQRSAFSLPGRFVITGRLEKCRYCFSCCCCCCFKSQLKTIIKSCFRNLSCRAYSRNYIHLYFVLEENVKSSFSSKKEHSETVLQTSFSIDVLLKTHCSISHEILKNMK